VDGMARRFGCGSAGAGAAANGPAERPSHDVHDLIDVFLGIAALGRGPDATLDMVFEDEDGQGVDRGAEGARLLEDVDAVLLALDHPGDAPHLPLDPGKAPDQLGLVAGVRVPEGVGARRGIRSGHPPMILPRGIPGNPKVRSRRTA